MFFSVQNYYFNESIVDLTYFNIINQIMNLFGSSS